jgi:hypothetical protein
MPSQSRTGFAGAALTKKLDFEHKLKVKRSPATAGNHSSRRV